MFLPATYDYLMEAIELESAFVLLSIEQIQEIWSQVP